MKMTQGSDSGGADLHIGVDNSPALLMAGEFKLRTFSNEQP